MHAGQALLSETRTVVGVGTVVVVGSGSGCCAGVLQNASDLHTHAQRAVVSQTPLSIATFSGGMLHHAHCPRIRMRA